MQELNTLIASLEQALLSLDRLKAQEVLQSALTGQVEPLIVATLEKIGEGWETGDVALSQIYMSGRICEDLLNTILEPNNEAIAEQPKMAIAELHDYHLLGKRIVYSIMRASGFDLLDYGQKEVDELVELVQKNEIKILLISTLMLPSALKVKEVRAKLELRGLDVKIVVGGAPFRFDEQLYKDVDADAMGKSASDAIKIVKTMIEEQK
ncbi:MAG: cobalamin-dependent protein [SAR324 cluster bacterium]|nr:cobalamin-dependent protein [SAR324 cluster bacterium]